MRIPVFEEIKLSASNSVNQIEEELIKRRVGEVPLYFNATEISENDFHILLPNIMKAHQNVKAHPLFPYPMYIITTYINSHKYFPIVESKGKLPRHFIIKNKQFKSREMAVYNKIVMLTKKIGNLSLEQTIVKLNNAFLKQKKLYNLTKEARFYEKIWEKLNDTGTGQ